MSPCPLAQLRTRLPSQCIGWQHYLMLLTVGYIALVLFGSSLPGKPAYAVEWHTLVETWHCSINFFYVNQILNWLGIHVIESVAVGLWTLHQHSKA